METMELSSEGYLSLSRRGYLKRQLCPYSQNPEDCGDWCPLFIEPTDHSSDEKIKTVRICNSRILIGELTDRRPFKLIVKVDDVPAGVKDGV